MKWRKITAILTAAVVVIAGAAACQGNGKDTKEEGSAAEGAADDADSEDDAAGEEAASGVTDEKIILTTMSMLGGTDPSAEAYQDVLARYSEKYPNVTIEDTSQPSDQAWKAKVAAQFSVGDEPDVLQFFTDNNANEVLATDKFVTIEEIQAEYPDFAADILDNAWAASANPDGVNRAVPTVGYWEGLFCNADLFEEYGISLPETWADFMTAVETFKENGVIPIAVSLNEVPHYWVEHLMLAEAGPEDFTSVPEPGNVPEGWISGLNLITSLYEMGAFPEDCQTISNDAAGELFKTKKAAMQLDGSWFAGGVDDQDNTVVIPFPNTENGKKDANEIIGGLSSGYYITKKAWDDPEKRGAAVEFVKMHTSKEQIEVYWAGNGMATVELDAPDDMTPLGVAGLELSNTATGTYEPTDARISAEAYSAIITSIVDLVNGSKTAEEILDNALEINLESME